jgi:mono/diheme cytochrome c family protein
MKSIIKLCAGLIVLGWGAWVMSSAVQAAPKADGAAIYKERCAMCHHADGKGIKAMKMPDFTDPKWQASVTDKQLVEGTENGVKGTAMPGFKGKLTTEEIQAVVAHIRSFNTKKK